jgi:hypothetical protein
MAIPHPVDGSMFLFCCRVPRCFDYLNYLFLSIQRQKKVVEVLLNCFHHYYCRYCYPYSVDGAWMEQRVPSDVGHPIIRSSSSPFFRFGLRPYMT